jgi:8-oxo-dGTP pyrophosphatase MutT (NUDIX family)
LTSGVSIKIVIKKLSKVLAERQIWRANDSKQTASAVLMPIFRKDGEYHLLFMQRTDRVKTHKGQISFPGGAYEVSDGTLLNTALRESEEEVGIVPGDVKVIGQLDDMATAGSNYTISPFVGVIPYPYKFKLDGWETEELIQVPISALLDKSCFSEGTTIVNGKQVETYFYQYGNKTIWGATARILKQFLEIVTNL